MITMACGEVRVHDNNMQVTAKLECKTEKQRDFFATLIEQINYDIAKEHEKGIREGKELIKLKLTERMTAAMACIKSL